MCLHWTLDKALLTRTRDEFKVPCFGLSGRKIVPSVSKEAFPGLFCSPQSLRLGHWRSHLRLGICVSLTHNTFFLRRPFYPLVKLGVRTRYSWLMVPGLSSQELFRVRPMASSRSQETIWLLLQILYHPGFLRKFSGQSECHLCFHL